MLVFARIFTSPGEIAETDSALPDEEYLTCSFPSRIVNDSRDSLSAGSRFETEREPFMATTAGSRFHERPSSSSVITVTSQLAECLPSREFIRSSYFVPSAEENCKFSPSKPSSSQPEADMNLTPGVISVPALRPDSISVHASPEAGLML